MSVAPTFIGITGRSILKALLRKDIPLYYKMQVKHKKRRVYSSKEDQPTKVIGRLFVKGKFAG
ncbi:hypothetical protein PAUR_a0174 [Pseudoalteromonas aurantia 208]|uniref:Uncharacterized protein n=1 Tax=Pseudoalteromonas aurantia 208 TaxID=1314867 RepID=A0ABR9E7E3_9GAMM|nr:hypothetical protein [Pseudoalteromonas aurantia 208]